MKEQRITQVKFEKAGVYKAIKLPTSKKERVMATHTDSQEGFKTMFMPLDLAKEEKKSLQNPTKRTKKSRTPLNQVGIK